MSEKIVIQKFNFFSVKNKKKKKNKFLPDLQTRGFLLALL